MDKKGYDVYLVRVAIPPLCKFVEKEVSEETVQILEESVSMQVLSKQYLRTESLV